MLCCAALALPVSASTSFESWLNGAEAEEIAYPGTTLDVLQFAVPASTGGALSSVLSLNPGWQFVWEFTPNFCSGSTCTTPASCTTVNCTPPLTINDTCEITFIGGDDNVTIASVSGAGTGWTNAGCHSYQSGLSDLDTVYTLAASTAAQGFTVNLSGSLAHASAAYLDIACGRPPSGHSAVFDGCAVKVNTACTTGCIGGAPAVTGTDFIVQVPNFNSGGFTNTIANPWPSPYYSNYEGDGVCVNCLSGTGAPTFNATPSSPLNVVGISFKTDAASFTPPTKIFSLVQRNLPNIGASSNCTPICPARTIVSATAGNLLYVTEFDSTGGTNSITSISGGCGVAWVIPIALHKDGVTGGWELNHAYCKSATGGAVSITPTMSTTVAAAFFAIDEVARTSGSWGDPDVGAEGCTLNAGAANFMPAGQPLTLSNTNSHVTFQSIIAPGGVDGASFYLSPYGPGANGTVIGSNSTGSSAILLNDNVGNTPLWPFPGVTSTTTTAPCGASFQ